MAKTKSCKRCGEVIFKINPAYCPNKSFHEPLADIPALSGNKAKILRSMHCRVPVPQS